MSLEAVSNFAVAPLLCGAASYLTGNSIGFTGGIVFELTCKVSKEFFDRIAYESGTVGLKWDKEKSVVVKEYKKPLITLVLEVAKFLSSCKMTSLLGYEITEISALKITGVQILIGIPALTTFNMLKNKFKPQVQTA